MLVAATAEPEYVSAHVSDDAYALNGLPCEVVPSALYRYAPVITCFGTEVLGLELSVTCVAVKDVAQLPEPFTCAFNPTAGREPLGTKTVELVVKMYT